MNMTWEDAVLKVLREAEGDLHYREISDEIIKNQYKGPNQLGKTPATTVNSTLGKLIREKPDVGLERTNRGRYILQEVQKRIQEQDTEKTEQEQAEDEIGFLQCFGMFWRRDRVDWTRAEIFGSMQGGEPLNFYFQTGVYILYDGSRPIYVGRACPGRLGVRLTEHTRDRLTTRWDRFSWFGLLKVSPEGHLQEVPNYCSDKMVATTLEALLIEAMEPPLNRKRGDSLESIECLQV